MIETPRRFFYNMVMKEFGENLRKIREEQKISQSQLAEQIGTTQQYVSRLESGKHIPSLYFFLLILRALDVSFEELTDGISLPDPLR